MPNLAYLFERFPSYTQTFCHREVEEMLRQGVDLTIFSLRGPETGPQGTFGAALMERVVYLPEEKALMAAVSRASRGGALPEVAARSIEEWGRRPDFLRLFQAAFIGLQLRDQGIRRLHAHFAGMAARTAYWIREFFGIEFSFTGHANDILTPQPFEVGLSRLVEAATAVVGVSDCSVSFLKEKYPTEASRIHRVYNGIRFSSERVTRPKVTPPLILSIGRLVAKKGFDDLIAACAALKARGVDFRCEIIGEGPLQEWLGSALEGYDLSGEVTLAGARSEKEIARRLREATVFALACKRDAQGGIDVLPTVIMEAMAAELPVISTRLGGIDEMVEEDGTGILVEPGDSAALARALEIFLGNAELAQASGKRGRLRAENFFSVERNVASLRAILLRD